MTPTFDLCAEPWIPVRLEDTSRIAVGLRDLVARAPEIITIETDPVIAVAPITRFAIALTLRSQGAPLGDPSPPAWQRWGTERLEAGPDIARLDAYLDHWADRFWLLHPTHPFLQDPAIADECPKTSTTNKLRIDAASGNNALWWTKDLDAEAPTLDHATAATALVTQWGYGAGGRCSSRSGRADSKQSPLRARSQFLLQGSNLWATLLGGAAVVPGDERLAERDRCWWEREADDLLVPGPLARLTASPRGLLLVGDEHGVNDAYLTWGAQLDDAFWDADVLSARKRIRDGSMLPYRLSPTAATWAEAPALLAKVEPGTVQEVDGWIDPPAVLDVARNPIGATSAFDELGLTVITHFPDQSKDLGWHRSDLPGVVRRLEAVDYEGYVAVEHLCTFARGAIRSTRQALKEAGVPRSAQWEQACWARAELAFWATVSSRAWVDEALSLVRACRSTLEQAAEDLRDPVHIKRYLAAEGRLTAAFLKLVDDYGLRVTEGAR